MIGAHKEVRTLRLGSDIIILISIGLYKESRWKVKLLKGK